MHRNFLKLYNQYFDDIYRYVIYKTGSSWDADDVTSDIFRKAYEKFESTKVNNPKAWLFMIARNTVIDFYRRKKEISTGEDIESYGSPCLLEEMLENNEKLKCLKKALDHLPAEDRETIILRFFSNMKYDEIGAVLEKSGASVKMRCSRALKKVKYLVEKCLEG